MKWYNSRKEIYNYIHELIIDILIIDIILFCINICLKFFFGVWIK